MSREYLAGSHAVREALRAGRREHVALLLAERSGGQAEIETLAREARIPVRHVAAEELNRRLPGVRHQGAILETGPLPIASLDSLLAAEAPNLLVALDGIEDPQNLGALLRVADGAGVNGVILPQRRSAPLGVGVARASAGALEHVPLARPTNLARALQEARREGCWLVGADAGAEMGVYDAAATRIFRESMVLVLGSEERGIRPGVRKHLDTTVALPGRGRVASLNVAAAGAAILYEVLRVRMS